MLTILGARTRRLWPHLRSQAAAALTAGRRCVLLVPEQYTLQAERDLIRDLSLPGFFDIEVFSLSRFVQRLFLICGSNRVRVDGNGKNIALARALLSCKKNLKYYARSVSRRGFIAQSGEWIADMKRAQITPDKLQTYADSLPESAYAEKMCDLARIYGGYSDILADKFVDGEDVLAAAIDAVPQSKLVQDADVLVYGFDVITDDFARLLCAITASCSATWVYLVMDRQDAPGRRLLCACARQRGASAHAPAPGWAAPRMAVAGWRADGCAGGYPRAGSTPAAPRARAVSADPAAYHAL